MKVVVIGGGVIGTSVAYYLCKRGGVEIDLVEQRSIASGATGRSVGIVSPIFHNEVNIRMAKLGYDEIRRFKDATGCDPDFHKRPYFETISSDAQLRTLKQGVHLQRMLGVESTLVEPEEVASIFPEMNVDDIVCGAFSPDAGFVDPHQLANAYASAAKDLGVRVLLGCCVTGLLQDGKRVNGVQTSSGTIQADAVVNAAGPWANEVNKFAGFSIPLDLWQRQIFVTTPHPSIPNGRPIYIDLSSRFYFRQELDGGFVLGLVEDLKARELMNPETDWTFKTKTVEAAVRRVPMMAELSIRNGWSGVVDFTPDQLPVLGPVPSIEGFYLANGLSGYGVMISPAVGILLSEWILNGKPRTMDASRLSYDRILSGEELTSTGLWVARAK